MCDLVTSPVPSARIASRCVCVFFQAEDGIRYLTVTGVQTCALPIYLHRIVAVVLHLRLHGLIAREREFDVDRSLRQGIIGDVAGRGPGLGDLVDPDLRAGRSEERRVGKECSSVVGPVGWVAGVDVRW